MKFSAICTQNMIGLGQQLTKIYTRNSTLLFLSFLLTPIWYSTEDLNGLCDLPGLMNKSIFVQNASLLVITTLCFFDFVVLFCV